VNETLSPDCVDYDRILLCLLLNFLGMQVAGYQRTQTPSQYGSVTNLLPSSGGLSV